MFQFVGILSAFRLLIKEPLFRSPIVIYLLRVTQCRPVVKIDPTSLIIIIIYRFLERHILKALWRFTILKINKKLQKTIKSLFKKKGLKAPFECV